MQPSKSPWASPVVIVRKKDRSAIFCIDYRKVNAITRKDAYPLPRIDNTLDTLAVSQWFSTLDLRSWWLATGRLKVPMMIIPRQLSQQRKGYSNLTSCNLACPMHQGPSRD